MHLAMHRIIGIDDIMHIIHRHIRTLNTVSIERSVLCVYVCLVHMHIESYVRIKKTNQRTVTGPNRSRAQCTIPMKRSLVHSSSRLLSNTLCCITLYWFAFMYRIKSNKVAAHDDDMLPCSRGDDSLSNIFFFIFGATLYSLIHKS